MPVCSPVADLFSLSSLSVYVCLLLQPDSFTEDWTVVSDGIIAVLSPYFQFVAFVFPIKFYATPDP
jgi:hypothetical protein